MQWRAAMIMSTSVSKPARITSILAHNIWNKSELYSIWCMLDRITEPVKIEASSTIFMQKTRRGCKEWVVNDAITEISLQYLEECWNAVYDTDALVKAALVPFGNTGFQFVHGADVGARICGAVWDYLVSLVSAEVLWLRRYSHALPGRFFALLCPTEQPHVLAQLRTWWDMLLDAEKGR